MRTSDFDYDLPLELIAQAPAPERDQSLLMVLERGSGRVSHRAFPDLLGYLRKGDVLVLNDTRVIPARLRGCKAGSGGRIEVLLVEENRRNDWWVMLRPAKRVKAGTQFLFDCLAGLSAVGATVIEKGVEGHCRLEFSGVADVADHLEEMGEVPLPPYITRLPNTERIDDTGRYQTVYARVRGSVAAPTAGLHFTAELLERIRRIGVNICFVTLHVGPGTFAPVKAATLAEHQMHEESFSLNIDTVDMVNRARQSGHRVFAVGTTSMRVLESAAAQNGGEFVPAAGRTRLFIYPPYRFRVVDALLTNFHLPKSTLLMLVCAFASPGAVAGRGWVLSAYREAIAQRYRFFSYGDAMLVL
ncbi:MAG: tRNA preQ1(34) S-adenosylmethionine ribosyltransferase-isomerase QueA [Candidatus Omnitrophica bacterium]|nr:tRNA preQ1(34) S-adenosylmethionine ribosyltransferase-isomerase QueA [Candidatus Omnitrophota bacterium]